MSLVPGSKLHAVRFAVLLIGSLMGFAEAETHLVETPTPLRGSLASKVAAPFASSRTIAESSSGRVFVTTGDFDLSKFSPADFGDGEVATR